MSDNTIEVPEFRYGQVGLMLYQPHYSTKKGAWVPGAYPEQTSVRVDPWPTIAAALMEEPIEVSEKGKIPSISFGVLFDGSKKRSNLNVRSVHALALDIDTGQEDIEFVFEALAADDLDFVFYTTWSHQMPGKGARGRFMVQLTEPIPAIKAKKAIRAAWDKYTRNAAGRIAADQSCIDPARVSYLPAYPPGRRSSFHNFHHKGVGLPPIELYEHADGLAAVDTSTLSSSDRITTITGARGSLPPAARQFSREDLAKLSKNKKAPLTPTQRAALLAASKGERMVVVAGERSAAVVKLGVSKGGKLADDGIDTFLTSLMFQVALRRRDAEPAHVQTAFAPSLTTLQEEDAKAGNAPYDDDALRLKFESGVAAADEHSVEDAKKSGLPTVAEFKIAQALEEDEGDLSNNLPGKCFLGRRSFYMIRGQDEEGEAKLAPLSDFAAVPTARFVGESTDAYRHEEVLYEMDFIDSIEGETRTRSRIMPPDVLMGVKSFNEYLAPLDPLAWRGDDQQTRYLRRLFQDYITKHKLPQKTMTHELGLRKDGGMVTPIGSYRWTAGFKVELDESVPVFAPSERYQIAEKLKQEMERRGTDIDMDAIRTYAQNVTRQSAPEVAWAAAGWNAATALRASLSQFPVLQVVGSRGSGKSSIARRWREAMCGTEVAVGRMPRYSQAKECTGNLSAPVTFEEFRTGAHHSVQGTRDLGRDVYTGQNMSRQGMTTLTLKAPLCIVGEHELARGLDTTDGATLQRMVFARPETTMIDPRRDPDAPGRREAYGKLGKIDIAESGMWLLYPCWAAQFAPAATDMVELWRAPVDAYISTLPETVQRAVDERTRYNLSVLAFGAKIWALWCAFVGADPGPEPTIAQICRCTLETVVGSVDGAVDEHSDPLARFVEVLSMHLTEATAGSTAMGVKTWWMAEEGVLYIDVKAALNFCKVHSGGTDTTFSSPAAIYQFARESKLAVMHASGTHRERHRKRIPGSGTVFSRCVALDIEILEEDGVDIADSFLLESSRESTFS